MYVYIKIHSWLFVASLPLSMRLSPTLTKEPAYCIYTTVVYIHVCMYVCMYVCIYVCIYVYTLVAIRHQFADNSK